MTRPLLLVHGWGFDAAIWDAIAALLPDRLILRAEAGYLGAEPSWPAVPPGTIAVGHSAGVLALLDRWPPGCAGLISIAGFSRFAAAADWPGVPDRVLARMARDLDAAPERALSAFRQRCGADSDPGDRLAPDRLAAGLEALRFQDARAVAMRMFADGAIPLLALAAEDDPIVTASHTSACFPPDRVRWTETGGHLLPATRPDWCAALIGRFTC
ncbi:biotin synthase [Acetobacteraceae bacterium KSS8]|uniref:Biotin synthase n=1 Tax=Endosaccharibacter trunci TaxID=2812733 RepID=A0ABT1W354_9PROT|nr:biotin synthase [Acetobacteraceae bacterium KSS8]